MITHQMAFVAVRPASAAIRGAGGVRTMRANAAKEKIGGGVLTLAGLLAATMIDRLIPDHPSLLVWFTAVAAILLMIAGGLALAVWPRGPVARPVSDGRAPDRSAEAAHKPDTLRRATFHLLSRARMGAALAVTIAVGLVVLVTLGVAAGLFWSKDSGRSLMTPPEPGDPRVHTTGIQAPRLRSQPLTSILLAPWPPTG